jgi:hypothetical protein
MPLKEQREKESARAQAEELERLRTREPRLTVALVRAAEYFEKHGPAQLAHDMRAAIGED